MLRSGGKLEGGRGQIWVFRCSAELQWAKKTHILGATCSLTGGGLGGRRGEDGVGPVLTVDQDLWGHRGRGRMVSVDGLASNCEWPWPKTEVWLSAPSEEEQWKRF